LAEYNGGRVQIGHEERVSKEAQTEFLDGVAVYEIVHRKKIAKLVSWNHNLPISVLNNLVHEKRIERLGLSNEKEFILTVQKYYTLMNLKMAMNSMPVDDRSKWVTLVLKDIREWNQYNREAMAFVEDIESQFARIHDRYKKLYMSVWGDTGNSIRRVWSKVVGAEDRDEVEKVIEAEILQADEWIERFVKAHPHLNHQLDHLMKPNAVMTCRKAIE
jgi:hypothetical protein